MATGERKDPFRNFNFRLELKAIQEAAFSEATIPDTTSDVIEYREGYKEQNKTNTVRKLQGLTKYANITLKKGITDSMEIYNWRKLVEDGDMDKARQNIAITLLDEKGKDAARWEFANAWPSKYDAPDLTAKGNDVAIETLEIVHEGMVKVK
jgi:phage tail-like protein